MKTTTLYILHFSAPYFHARHYIGSTADFDERIRRHRERREGKLIAAVLDAGIDFEAFVIGHGNRDDERKLKKQKNAKRHCPRCRAEREKENESGNRNETAGCRKRNPKDCAQRKPETAF